MSRILMAFLLLSACVTSLPAQTPAKIKVLILTGVSNHAWRLTTPVLREILERTGKFDVHVNEEVRGNTLDTFSPYDVLLLNYSDWKNAGPWWDNGARQALLDFVRNGKGLVSYHSSNERLLGLAGIRQAGGGHLARDGWTWPLSRLHREHR